MVKAEKIHGTIMFRAISIFIVLIAICDLSVSRTGHNECIVNLGPDPNRYLPLFVSRVDGLRFPKGSRSIRFQDRERLQVLCPGRNNTIIGQRDSTIDATCKNGGRLLKQSTSSPFTMNCSMPVTETIREPGRRCGKWNRSNIIQIGWPLGTRGFHPEIEICFDEENLSTEYSWHIIRGSGIAFRDRDTPWLNRRSFKMDKYFSGKKPSIVEVYNKGMQREIVTRLVGSGSRAEAYIGGWGPNSFLSKGHLSPDADFIYQTWQDATYHFINVVPQWQAFNNGNWKVLEGALRVQATKPSPRDLHVYTGTYGVVKLLDVNNNEVDFYLLNGDKRGVPVPEYIWKFVVDYNRNEAVVFVLVNHPANPLFPHNERTALCPDVCHRIRWVKWKSRNDASKGLIYCCTAQSLRDKIAGIPNKANFRLMET